MPDELENKPLVPDVIVVIHGLSVSVYQHHDTEAIVAVMHVYPEEESFSYDPPEDQYDMIYPA